MMIFLKDWSKINWKHFGRASLFWMELSNQRCMGRSVGKYIKVPWWMILKIFEHHMKVTWISVWRCYRSAWCSWGIPNRWWSSDRRTERAVHRTEVSVLWYSCLGRGQLKNLRKELPKDRTSLLIWERANPSF